MTRIAIAYVVTLAALVCLDLAWFRVAADAIFRPRVGEMLTDKPNLIAAALFYLCFAGGLVYFAIAPALRADDARAAAMNAAILGFLGYMTFDLTSLALLRGWSVTVSVVDIAWGMFASTLAASLGYWAAGRV